MARQEPCAPGSLWRTGERPAPAVVTSSSPGPVPGAGAPEPVPAFVQTARSTWRRSSRECGLRAERAAAAGHPQRLSPARTRAAPAPHRPRLPARLGDLDELHQPLAAPGRRHGLRRTGELPPAVRGSQFWKAAAVTVVYAGVTSAAKLALGLGFALLLARPFRGRALVFLAIFLPWAYPAGVSVIGWYWTLSPPITTAYSLPFMGQIKYAVDGVLGGGAWAFVSVTLFNIWRGSSFVGVLLLAGINAIPPGAVRVRAALDRRALAPLLAGDGAAAQAVPRARRCSFAHQRLRRPRQCLDAHRRPHRLPRHRHTRLLARHQGRAVRARLGAVADARAVPARGAPRAVLALRPGRAGDAA